jgi:glycosyltransferase involved in cell wall biosynthesis
VKLFINLSNLVQGGSLQVAHSFLSEINKLTLENSYLVVSNKNFYIDTSLFDSRFQFQILESSPSKFSNRFKIGKKLTTLEQSFNPDIVFTLFGPSYWKPKSLHVSGFADGWVNNPHSVAYKKLNLISRYKRLALNYYKTWRIKLESTHYIMETDESKDSFSKILKIPKIDISVVPNTFNYVFKKKLNKINKYSNLFNSNYFNLLTISSYYPHKNFEIIPEVIRLLPKNNLIKFYVTLENNMFSKIFKNHTDSVINLGPVDINSCPYLYELSSAVFLPTLLETFSASYPEAMIMNKPILTSNLDFAKDLCGDAALYFDSFDPKSIAHVILELSENKNLYNNQIDKSKKRSKIFISAKERALKYLDIFEKINTKND